MSESAFNPSQKNLDKLDTFDSSWTLDEYRNLIVLSLMYCMSWPEYHENYERASKCAAGQEHYIHEAYEDRETPNSAAAEVGFCCG